ncbi:PqqD family protein [Halobacteriovorax marinus]|uniref:PqqD family protein n=1 Tax=Halobacteriovorax marinus TaxID=97084 RepID=UPI003A95A826
MFIKRGHYNKERTTDRSNPILNNPEGKSFQVTYMSAFIWEALDGETSINEISQKIEETSKLDKPELSNIVESIVHQLRDVGLVGRIG